MGLQEIDKRLERLVEGTFAKAFRGGLQPVEIGKRIMREMDLRRSVGLKHVIAPNVFEVLLSPKDMARMEPFHEAMVHELREAIREHAREEGYALVGPVEVYVEEDPSLKAGVFLLAGEVREQENAPWFGVLLFDDGTELPLGEGVLTIGRMAGCDVVLPDPGVSRRHVEIRCLDDRVVAADLGSTNGTRVNGAKISEKVLSDGDTLAVGNSTIRFKAL